jgi:hypothetical protein
MPYGILEILWWLWKRRRTPEEVREMAGDGKILVLEERNGPQSRDSRVWSEDSAKS